MVDTYFEIRNDNNVVVIDDNYQNLCFVHKSEIVTVKASDEKYSGNLGWQNLSDGSYGRYESFSRIYTFEELGLVRFGPSFVGIRRVDSIDGGFTMLATIAVMDSSTPPKQIGFKYRINSMEVGAQYQMVGFTYLSYMTPSKEGLQIYNAKQELVFDAARGYMQVMDSQYHLRDLYSSATQSFSVYNSNLPDVDYSKMFLISRQRPMATTGGTIRINNRQYVPRLRKDLSNKIYVDLGMWGAIGGNRLQQYQNVFSFMVAHVHF